MKRVQIKALHWRKEDIGKVLHIHQCQKQIKKGGGLNKQKGFHTRKVLIQTACLFFLKYEPIDLKLEGEPHCMTKFCFIDLSFLFLAYFIGINHSTLWTQNHIL